MPSIEAISTLIQDSSSEPPSMMTGSERMQMTPVEPSSHESGGKTAMSDAGSSHTAVDEVQSQVGQVDDVPPIEGTELKSSSSNDSLQVNLDGAATPTKAPIGILQRHNLPLTPPPDYEAVSMQPPPIPPRPAQKDEATEQIEAWTEQQDVREVMENIIHQLRWAVKSEGKALDNEQIDAITRWVVFYYSQTIALICPACFTAKTVQSTSTPRERRLIISIHSISYNSSSIVGIVTSMLLWTLSIWTSN